MTPEEVAGHILTGCEYVNIPIPLANLVGLNGAVILKAIENWCISNARHKKKAYFRNGYWWTHATYQDWLNQFKFLGSTRSIQRTVLELEKQGLIISEPLSKGKFDRTKWYRLNRRELGALYLKAFGDIFNPPDDAETTENPIVPEMDDDDDNLAHRGCQNLASRMPNLDAHQLINKKLGEEELIKQEEPIAVFEQTSPFQNSTVLTEEKEQPQTQTDDPKPLKESSANLSQKKITTARWRETGKLGKHGYPNVVNMQGIILELLPWVELNDTLRSGYGFNPEFEAFVSKQQVKKKYFSDMRPGEFVAAIKDWIGRAATDEERFGQVMRRWEMFERNLIDEGTKTVKELYQESEREKRWQAIAQGQPMPTEPQPAKPERKKLTIKDAM